MEKSTAKKSAKAKDPLDFVFVGAPETRAPAKKNPSPRKKAPQTDPYDDPMSVSPAPKPHKKAGKADPYDDPTAAAPKPRKKAASTSARKTSAKVQENPLAAIDQTDPYDVPAAAPKPRKKAASTSARKTSAKVQENPLAAVDQPDPYDAPVPRRKPAKAAPKDELDDVWGSAPKRVKKPSRSRKKRKKGSPLTVLLVLAILACLALGVWQSTVYASFAKMRDAVDGVSFFAGTRLDGVELADLSLEDALTHWETQIEPQYANRTVTLSTGQSATAAQLGYSSDYREVLAQAWRAQGNGTLAERYEALQRASQSGNALTVNRRMYDPDLVKQAVSLVAQAENRAVTEAGVSGFDPNTLSFTFSEGTPGRILKEDKLVQDLEYALDNDIATVEAEFDETQPTVTVADVQNLYGMRAYAVTNASSSSKNRLSNIRLALSSINAVTLQPGEVFSFNDTVGKRTAERGYKMAGAYSAGEVTEELGGGICQVSTTLFNAAVKADLEIVERHNHSIPVSYVDKGKDATVNWGNQDMRFKNNTDSPVCIVAYLDDKKRVRVGIFGKAMPNGETVTVEAKLIHTDKYETTYQLNSFLTPGTTNVLQEGRNGYKAEAYKLRWDADGNLISKELLCTSNYPKRNEIVEYGPQ